MALRLGVETERCFRDLSATARRPREAEITKAVAAAVFFIPIVTPRAVGSEYCKFEFDSFLARERALAAAIPQRSGIPDSLHFDSRVAGRGGVARRSTAVDRRQTQYVDWQHR